MAHIRYATAGGVSLCNVHPFQRELWGIQWVFSHNGQVPKFDDSTEQKDQPLLGKTREDDIQFNPVGDTDSEAVFCAILNALRAEFDELPTLPVLHRFLTKLCDEIIRGDEDSTIFNFLLGCGQYTSKFMLLNTVCLQELYVSPKGHFVQVHTVLTSPCLAIHTPSVCIQLARTPTRFQSLERSLLYCS